MPLREYIKPVRACTCGYQHCKCLAYELKYSGSPESFAFDSHFIYFEVDDRPEGQGDKQTTCCVIL